MPSVRSVVLLALLVFVLSLVGACLSFLEEPDSGGRGRDSYGTKRNGYRGLLETLSELGIPTERRLTPPEPGGPKSTVLLLQPDPDLAGFEPTYLHALLPWVEQGGRIVLATRETESPWRERESGQSETPIPNLFETLGLAKATLRRRSVYSGETVSDSLDKQLKGTPSDFVREVLSNTNAEPITRPVTVEGTLLPPNLSVTSLAIPASEIGTLDPGDLLTSGTLRCRIGKDETEMVLAAAFPRGKGTIVVVAEPALFNNRLLALEENSLLAAGLVSPEGEPVVFDEFFHGLSVRGNSLFLMTRPGYAALALGLLLVTGLFVWREAIALGPPLADPVIQRRDIGEYVNAMGRFLAGGSGSRPQLVEELRDGVLRELCKEFSLPEESGHPELVAGLAARRNPRRGERIETTFREIDASLASNRSWSEAQTLEAMRRLMACLSKSV